MRVQHILKTCTMYAALLACAACSQSTTSKVASVTRGVASPAGATSTPAVTPAPVAVVESGKDAEATGAASFYMGTWAPISNSYQGMGNLTLNGRNGLHWYKCRTSYVEQPDPPKAGVLLVLSPDSVCVLDDRARTRVLFLRVAKPEGKCDLTVSAYASENDVRYDRPAAEGTFARTGCK